MVQFLFIFKHPKRFHSITELLGVLVVYFSRGCEANGRGDAIVFLWLLLPTRHGAARETRNIDVNDSYTTTTTTLHVTGLFVFTSWLLMPPKQ